MECLEYLEFGIEKVIGFAVIEKVIISTQIVNKNQDESNVLSTSPHYVGK